MGLPALKARIKSSTCAPPAGPPVQEPTPTLIKRTPEDVIEDMMPTAKRRAARVSKLKEKRGAAPSFSSASSTSTASVSGDDDEEEEVMDEKERRKRERMLRNRESAALSRKRNRDLLEKLTNDNHWLRDRLTSVEDENRRLEEHNRRLRQRLSDCDLVGSATIAAPPASDAPSPDRNNPEVVETNNDAQASCFNRDPAVESSKLWAPAGAALAEQHNAASTVINYIGRTSSESGESDAEAEEMDFLLDVLADDDDVLSGTASAGDGLYLLEDDPVIRIGAATLAGT